MRLKSAATVETVSEALGFIESLDERECLEEPWRIAHALIIEALRSPGDALKEAAAREGFREAARQRFDLRFFRI